MLNNSFVMVIKLLSITLVVALTACSSAPKQSEQKELVFPEPPDPPRYYYQNTILSDLDVTKETEDAKVQRWLTGMGKTGKPMSKPYGVGVRNGNLYVSDPPARIVHQFDFIQNRYIEVGKEGEINEILVKPFEVAIDAAGNLYVVDRSDGNIKIYDNNGKFVKKIGQKEDFDMATGIAVNQDGSLIYVSDTGGVESQRHHILVYDGITGDLLRNFSKRGSGDGELNLPKGITLVNDKELYVVDSGNFRVVVFDVDSGEMLRTFGQIGRQLGMFSRPKSITTCGEDIIIISDASHGNIQLFNKQGQLLMFIGNRGNNVEPAKYMLTSGVSCDEDGRIYVADQFFKKVDVFRPASLAAADGIIPYNQD